MIELKSCPFCGEDPTFSETTEGYHDAYVECTRSECGNAGVVAATLEQAAKTWNTRYIDNELNDDDWAIVIRCLDDHDASGNMPSAYNMLRERGFVIVRDEK